MKCCDVHNIDENKNERERERSKEKGCTELTRVSVRSYTTRERKKERERDGITLDRRIVE